MLRKLFILFLLVNFCSSTNNIVLQDHERAWCINWSTFANQKLLVDFDKIDALLALTTSYSSAIDAVDKTKYVEVEQLTFDYFNENLKDGSTSYVEKVCKVWYDLEQGRNFSYDY